MADPPVLSFDSIALTFGGRPLFEEVTGQISAGDRIALVGRNGEGKSTLLKILAGRLEPDTGSVHLRSGSRAAYLEQDPDMSGCATLGDFARASVAGSEGWRVASVADGLGVDLDTPAATASGGERRRAALAGVLAADADCLLLDEPTNHLDIAAILWLEAELRAMRKAVVLISHDRAFLTALTGRTFWLDRGSLRVSDRGFAGFEAWRDTTFEEEDRDRHKLDRLIRSEGRWAVEGISARRKRNMGRVRRLDELRQTRADAVRRQPGAALALETADPSGKLVIEGRGLTLSLGGRSIVDGLSIRIARGDRIAIVGPNGVGKTTLIGLLTGRVAPDSGEVRLGTGLDVAVFDQARDTLAPDTTLWQALTEDPQIGASGRNDQVMVRGQPRHVVGYLKDFLFDEAQAHSPLSALSGGERARLHLARLMARPSNLLVLDEPTNDLDVETLDVLQEAIDGYAGTVILVSHDRDFVDRVATTLLAMEGNGRVTVHAGGYSDYLARKATNEREQSTGPAARKGKDGTARRQAAPPPRENGLSFTERHRFEALPAEISRLEDEIGKLTGLLSDPDLFRSAPERFRKASAALADRQGRLSALEEEWLILAEKAETG